MTDTRGDVGPRALQRQHLLGRSGPGAVPGSWHRAGWGLAAVTGLVLAGCAGGPARVVEIQRTAHGVAHVQAADLESLAHGVAWAQAEDRFCLTADHLLTVRGVRSRWFGAQARTLLGLRNVPNAESDLFVQFLMNDEALERAWQRDASPAAQALARGWVAGYNRFLADPSRHPSACRGQPWLQSMTLADYRRMQELLAVQAGIALFSDAILAAGAPAPAGATTGGIGLDEAALLAEWSDRGAHRPPLGSNAWAWGRATTRDGQGLLLGNPHFPWDGMNRFWQVHAVVPGQLDVMGAAIGAAALPQIGFNRDLAWTHTVSTGRRFTLHALQLLPQDPLSYRVDNRVERLQPRVLNIEVREADGRFSRLERTVWVSRYGPVLVLPRAGLGWTAGRAWALQDANRGNARAQDVWLDLARARRVDELPSALARLGLPWVNTVAADRHGDVLYADASVIPDVSADQLRRCAPVPEAARLFERAGLVLLDGARSECNWRRDDLSPVPGRIPLERLPVLRRSDWVHNANDSHWLTNPQVQLAGISPMVGPTGSPERMRTRTSLHELEQRLSPPGAGTPPRMDLAGAQALLLARRNHAAELVLDDLLQACPAAARREALLGEACDVLRTWDRRNQPDSRGAHLFREWWRQARELPGVWRVPANPEDPAATPAGLRLADPAVSTGVFRALGAAVRTVRSAGLALDAPLSAVQFRQLSRGRVAIPGGDEFEGVLDKVEARARPGLAVDGYAIDYGTSYVQAVSFDARGPVAEGLLVYGQSPDPASPWHFDALERWNGPRWPALPFHREDIERLRVGTVTRLVLP